VSVSFLLGIVVSAKKKKNTANKSVISVVKKWEGFSTAIRLPVGWCAKTVFILPAIVRDMLKWDWITSKAAVSGKAG
jgi:hypothetical protein